MKPMLRMDVRGTDMVKSRTPEVVPLRDSQHPLRKLDLRLLGNSDVAIPMLGINEKALALTHLT